MSEEDKVPPYKVVSNSPNLIQIEVTDIEEFKKNEQEKFYLGSFLKVSDDSKDISVIGIIQSYRIKDPVSSGGKCEPLPPTFLIDVQPLGSFENGKFRRGGPKMAIPPTWVEIATEDDLKKIFEVNLTHKTKSLTIFL